jgi:hypothetical protein
MRAKCTLCVLIALSSCSSLESTSEEAIVLVNTPILIRADKWTEWHHITKLMERMLKAQGRTRR